MNVTRLFDIPYHQLDKFPNDDCLCDKRGGQWVKTSTRQFVDQFNAASRGLLALGIKPGDKIATISATNRSEWNIMDMAMLQIGAINVPVYPTISEDDYKFIFNHAEVKLCILSDEELLLKVKGIKEQVPTLKEVYSFDDIPACKNWKEILSAGNEDAQQEVEKIKQGVKPGDLATIIYTSGTTGDPKGVMLSHDNIVKNALYCIPRLPCDEHSRALSFLPVCHVYERMIHYLYMVTGVSIYFAESMDTIGDNLREVKPHVFTAVPRLLEKVYDKIIAKGSALTGIKKGLFFWAVNLGLQYEPGGKGPWYNFQLKIANKLIFSKWREALGGNVQAVASGSAALQPRLARVFNAGGVPVYEGYGLTETSPVVSVNSKATGNKFGTVGPVIDGMQVKIAQDGEILVKGPCLMLGYYKRDDLTRAVLDSEGWFHTGDIGELDKDGFLKITDRKKELFKTSGGKYIAPQQMENKFKESGFVEQIMVIGEGQKFPAALIVPSFAFLRQWCAKHSIAYSTDAAMVKDPHVLGRFGQEVDAINARFGGWEQIKVYRLLAREWSVEGGELTPTLKLKRKEIMKKYAREIEGIYGR